MRLSGGAGRIACAPCVDAGKRMPAKTGAGNRRYRIVHLDRDRKYVISIARTTQE
jgi:hypothetical protein